MSRIGRPRRIIRTVPTKVPERVPPPPERVPVPTAPQPERRDDRPAAPPGR